MFNITLNGNKITVDETATVRDLFARVGLTDLRGVAVEMNETFIEDDQYSTPLKDGAVIEIVRFVGGG